AGTGERIGVAGRRGAVPDRKRTRNRLAEIGVTVHRCNRRRFLASAAAGGLAYAFGGTGNAAAADYKALVCVFLFGGNDSFNMVVPRTNAEYGVYAASRQNLAIAQASLLPINSL